MDDAARAGEVQTIRWHPGFYGAFEREFRKNKADLVFEKEYTLSKGPLFVDMLVIRVLTGVTLENEIGRIFRKHNICEYKGPGDALGVDAYYKTIAYACLYKCSGQTEDEIPAEEITISLIRDAYPRELIRHLEAEGLAVAEHFPGVYYVENGVNGAGQLLFPTQIVVTSRLEKDTHSALRILTRNAKEDDVRRFLEEARLETEQGERANVDAILQVSVSANMAMYEKIRREDTMCQALRELMKDEIEADIAAGELRGRQKGQIEGERVGMARGRQEGIQQGMLASIRNLMESMSLSADEAMNALRIAEADRPMFLSMLKQ